ncbi:CSL zinc finger [Nesidiocoris tenuis]|uniref:CSL zinc finger n=1 Tax=Nesidiocoris tenuis TaxID=355587 RepID=A0ABN7B3S3_9HEMI|nr:CSL zinc finger [Nesidiocoris tenuis]
MATLYDALGCSPACTLAELKAAYRALALSQHPDKRSGGASDFALVDRAWKTLRDPTARRAYDEAMLRSRMEDEPLPPYADYRLSQMDRRDDLYAADCRCGGTYVVSRLDLTGVGTECLVGCDECSLTISVVDDLSTR